MKIISLKGNSQKLDGGAMFGNAPKAMWSRFVKVDEENRIPLNCRSMLVITDDDRKVLFEVGIGNFFEPRLKERFGVVESQNVLLEELSRHGFSEEDVDAVVLSHMHFDHAGGLLSPWEEGTAQRLLFPNAQIYTSEENFARAVDPHPRDRASFVPELNELLQQSDRFHLVARSGEHDLGSWLHFRFSDGHTPGLMMAEVTDGKRRCLYASDLIPGAPWVRASLTMGYDRYAERLIDEKREILREYCDSTLESVLFFTHDPDLSMARVVRNEKGQFSAVPYEWLN